MSRVAAGFSRFSKNIPKPFLMYMNHNMDLVSFVQVCMGLNNTCTPWYVVHVVWYMWYGMWYMWYGTCGMVCGMVCGTCGMACSTCGMVCGTCGMGMSDCVLH